MLRSFGSFTCAVAVPRVGRRLTAAHLLCLPVASLVVISCARQPLARRPLCAPHCSPLPRPSALAAWCVSASDLCCPWAQAAVSENPYFGIDWQKLADTAEGSVPPTSATDEVSPDQIAAEVAASALASATAASGDDPEAVADALVSDAIAQATV